jgi:manganese/zinc/iron transport system permease protein
MYYLLSYGILAGISLAIISGSLSSYLVSKRLSLLGDIMSHASFPGIVLMFLFTSSIHTMILLLGGFISALLSCFLVFFIQKKSLIPKDTAMALVLSFFFSIGLLSLGIVQKKNLLGQSILNNFIFGNFLSIVENDVHIFLIFATIILFIFFITRRFQEYNCFDTLYMKLYCKNHLILEYMFLSLIIMGIVYSLKIVGILLTSALMITPGTWGRFWGKSYLQILLISIVLSIACILSSILIVSHIKILPVGPLIILLLTLSFIISVYIKNKIEKSL